MHTFTESSHELQECGRAKQCFSSYFRLTRNLHKFSFSPSRFHHFFLSYQRLWYFLLRVTFLTEREHVHLCGDHSERTQSVAKWAARDAWILCDPLILHSVPQCYPPGHGEVSHFSQSASSPMFTAQSWVLWASQLGVVFRVCSLHEWCVINSFESSCFINITRLTNSQ